MAGQCWHCCQSDGEQRRCAAERQSLALGFEHVCPRSVKYDHSHIRLWFGLKKSPISGDDIVRFGYAEYLPEPGLPAAPIDASIAGGASASQWFRDRRQSAFLNHPGRRPPASLLSVVEERAPASGSKHPSTQPTRQPCFGLWLRAAPASDPRCRWASGRPERLLNDRARNKPPAQRAAGACRPCSGTPDGIRTRATAMGRARRAARNKPQPEGAGACRPWVPPTGFEPALPP